MSGAFRRWLVLGTLLFPVVLAAGGAHAAIDPPVLDASAVPYLNPEGRDSYRAFLLMNVPRAFALDKGGQSGWYGGVGTIEDARARALKSCADKGGKACAIYAEDLRIVWPGRESAAPAAAPGPLIETADYGFVPDPRFIWRGPGAARGVFVWGHGKAATGQDYRGQQPPPYVRAFNNAGFDIVRFERASHADYVEDAERWLRDGLPLVRKQGWRIVVVGGQSRGAWNSLQMLATPGLVDVVVAISPANFGGGMASATQAADFQRILSLAQAQAARVAVAQFTDDIYVKNMDERAEWLRQRLQPKVAALLLIDRPQDFTGHGAGNSANFSRRFGDCLLHFATDPTPAPDCGPTRQTTR